jgi:predicted HD phosphohydrolase
VASSPARRWWAEKIGRVIRYVRADMSPAERRQVAELLGQGELALFEAMPRADQRHGFDVATALRRAGYGADGELIVAGLLHDAGKGRSVRLWHRVAWSLGERYGSWIVRVAARVPGGRPIFERLEQHASRSAQLAHDAGATPRTVALIAAQAERHDVDDLADAAARALRLADDGELEHLGEGGPSERHA